MKLLLNRWTGVLACSCAAVTLGLIGAGCRSIGPATVPRDRSDYSASITESWKRQTLLNIVKLRYLDPPIFVDIGQIVAGYSLETSFAAGGALPETDSFGGDTVTLGGSARYTDRPTITYVPMTGTRFVKGLMTPIDPEALFFSIQSGWPADVMLFTGVATINGLKNESTTVEGYTAADPRFRRVAELMRSIQSSGAVGMKILQQSEKKGTTILTFRSEQIAPKTLEEIRELRELLNLDQETSEFTLRFGAAAANNREIAILTRTMLHIMGAMSARAEVPAEHIAEGRTMEGLSDLSDGGAKRRGVRIRCTAEKPEDAFVKVRYRDHWFWVDDRDLISKRAFSFVMVLFTLVDTGEPESMPLITIPAQ